MTPEERKEKAWDQLTLLLAMLPDGARTVLHCHIREYVDAKVALAFDRVKPPQI